MASLIRGVVSKKKKRFNESGYDLDLTYITPQIIAMGFPSTGQEALYRNPMAEVQRFFKERHDRCHKVYNLCSERSYQPTDFHQTERFPFDDHNPSALDMIGRFCSSVERYLAESPSNVVAIHCKAGKGRTGMMIACVLLHLGVCKSADESLALFGEMRTSNKKGVTIPSQVRYVYYYEQLLRRPEVTTNTYQITHVRMVTVPNFDPSVMGGGCDPYFHVRLLQNLGASKDQATAAAGGVTWKERKVFNYLKAGVKVKKCYPVERFVDLDCSKMNILIRGDTKIVFFDWDQLSNDDKMCHLWFHTAFVERNFLVFDKSVIDKACKDKHCRTFDSNFKIEIYLHRVDDKEFSFSNLDGDEEGGGGSDTDTDTDREAED